MVSLSYKTNSKKAVKDLLSTAGPATISNIESVLVKIFPYGPHELSKAETIFTTDLEASNLEGPNKLLAEAIPAARDIIATAIEHIQLLEKFIALHSPKMEDGNNFGVTVQEVTSKYLKEKREAWEKKLELLPKYYSNRAEAVEKLNLPKATSSETKTVTATESKGGKDGDENKTSTSTVKEEKLSNGKKIDYHRAKHLVALDVQCYAELRSALIGILDQYLSILDTIEKNFDKLEAPKGTGPGNSMGMY